VDDEQFEPRRGRVVRYPNKERVMHRAINTRVPHSIPVKLYRTADRLVIAAPMAGMRPEDVTIEVTVSGRLILQSRPRGVLRAELFDVAVTVDRDGDQEVWTREQWQETKEVVLDEWSTRDYYRELDLPAAVDAALGTVTYGNGVLVIALPVAETVRSARLQLVRLGEGRGERVGSVGHPA
jgi:HSP20 family protein